MTDLPENVPMKRCRQCGAYVPLVEIVKGKCLDCELENQHERRVAKNSKMKGDVI
jgi:hypothetical protein